EVKTLRDQAEAIRLYQKKVDASGQAAIIAGEIKVRAERRMGELLKAMPKNRGAATRLQGATALPRRPDLGIEKTESHRVQAIADVPNEEFEATIARARKAGRAPTSNELKTKGQSHKRANQKRAELERKAQVVQETSNGKPKLGFR